MSGGGGSLKLSISLNRGVCRVSDNDNVLSQNNEVTENIDVDEELENSKDSRPDSRSSTRSSGGVPSESNLKSANDNNGTGFLSMKIPTNTNKSRKRKHIKTNFDDSRLLDQFALDAQRKEKERLERLERSKLLQNDDDDYLAQMAKLRRDDTLLKDDSLTQVYTETKDDKKGVVMMDGESLAEQGTHTPLPVLDLEDDDLDMVFGADPGDKDVLKPSTSTTEHEVIELSSGDEDDIQEIGSYTPRRVLPPLPLRRRWYASDKERIAQEAMERQRAVEQERLRRRRRVGDLETVELSEGRLLVNAGHPSEDPDIYVSPHLTHVLQPHQLGGIRFMYDNIVESVAEYKSSSGFGCILAHSMGLGKTIQIVTFTEIFFRATKSHKALIIVPINTIQNWLNEFDKWMPKFSDTGVRVRQFEVFILGDTVKTFDQRVNLIEKWEKDGGVLLIGYDMFRRLIQMTGDKKPKPKGRPRIQYLNGQKVFRDEVANEKKETTEFDVTTDGRNVLEANRVIRRALLDPGPDLVVCDEGHIIKNLKTDISSALTSIRTNRRVVLTGYPLQNNLMEYYCMVDFVRPKYLGERKSFSTMFEKPIKNGQCVDSTPGDIKLAKLRTHVLVEMLRGFVQRRTHHLLKTILPECKEYVLMIRKSPLQHILYRNFLIYAQSEIKAGSNVFNPLKAFAACSKIWNHPDVLASTVKRKREERMKSDFEKAQRKAEQQQHQMISNQQMFMPPSPFGTVGMGANGNSFMGQPSLSGMTAGGSMHNLSFPYGMDNGMLGPDSYSMNMSQPQQAMPSNMDSWNGMFNSFDNTCDSDDSNGTKSLAGIATETSKKGATKAGRKKLPRTLLGALADELEMDHEADALTYDWADMALANYSMGVVENGYKMHLALEILDETTKLQEKILIFSQNLSALNVIEKFLEKRRVQLPNGEGAPWCKNKNYFRLDGSTNGSERERLINRFNSDSSINLFLISTRAGSLGINLVSANRCIIMDVCWNPCHDAQAVCRVFRYGQQRRSYIYRIVMDNSMERAIFNRQISKHGLQQRVVDDAQVEANVTQKELETLLMYDEAKDVVTEDWDMSDWNFDDVLLTQVASRNSRMLSEMPFLHETLILEREEGLSEQEKVEAQLLFEKERNDDATPHMYDSFSREGNPLAGITRERNSRMSWGSPFSHNFGNHLGDQPPLRATPMAKQLEMVQPGGFDGGSRMPGSISMPNLNLPTQGGGVSTSGRQNLPIPYNELGLGPDGGNMSTKQYLNHILHNRMLSGANDSGIQGFTFSDGMQAIPCFSFPGAAHVEEESFNNAGSMRKIILDREMCLPILSNPSKVERVRKNQECLLVRTGKSTYLKLYNGIILDASSSVLSKAPTLAPPPSGSVRLPPPLKPQMDDVIELD